MSDDNRPIGSTSDVAWTRIIIAKRNCKCTGWECIAPMNRFGTEAQTGDRAT